MANTTSTPTKKPTTAARNASAVSSRAAPPVLTVEETTRSRSATPRGAEGGYSRSWTSKTHNNNFYLSPEPGGPRSLGKGTIMQRSGSLPANVIQPYRRAITPPASRVATPTPESSPLRRLFEPRGQLFVAEGNDGLLQMPLSPVSQRDGDEQEKDKSENESEEVQEYVEEEEEYQEPQSEEHDATWGTGVQEGDESGKDVDPDDARALQLKAQFPNKGLPQACLFVASLSSSRTDEQLQESVTRHFEQYGTIMNVKVLKDWLARPYAFVQFENIDDARRALIEAHNTLVDNRHIRVEQARVNRTLFIAKFNKNLNEQADMEAQLREILERYGPVEDLTVLQNYQTGRSKGCGFVKFCYREDAIKAFLVLTSSRGEGGTGADGLRATHKWVAEWYAGQPPSPPPTHVPVPYQPSPSSYTLIPISPPVPYYPRAANLDRGNVEVDRQSIFVGQLNQTLVTREMVEEKFSKYGKIESLQFINRYQTGQNSRPAFAFIKYTDEADAERAVEEENGTTWLDRCIRVQFRETGEFRQRAQQFHYGHFGPMSVNQRTNAMMRGGPSGDMTMYAMPPMGRGRGRPMLMIPSEGYIPTGGLASP
ncbi:hypothetical protein HK104_011047, partial [Borealophlyctis nickersoniae]